MSNDKQNRCLLCQYMWRDETEEPCCDCEYNSMFIDSECNNCKHDKCRMLQDYPCNICTKYSHFESDEEIGTEYYEEDDNNESMRKILFRGKIAFCNDILGNKIGRWIYGSLLTDDLYNEAYIFDSITGDQIQVDTTTVGQYTGLEDNDKCDIYEGDIVTDLACHKYGLVCWSKEEASFIIKFKDYEICMNVDNINSFIVIGNKWDNPDLAEKY